MRNSILLLLLSWNAFAQDMTFLTPVQRLPASDKHQLGWLPHAKVGFNLSFVSNSGVVGQTEGSTQTYGLTFKGDLNHVTELTEWRNSLSLLEATTNSASLPRWVKSSDDVKYETIFLYSFPSAPKFGPYALGSVETSLFKGEDVRDADTTYSIHHLDGSTTSFTGTTLSLTDPFRPLTTKESAGLFWKALEEERLNLEARVGVGAMQINAGGQFAVKGKNDQGNIDVDELKGFDQLGVESGVFAKGKINDNSSYEFSASVLTPFIVHLDAGDDRSALRLTNIDVSAKLTSKITTWAAFGYDYRMKIQPQLVDQTQQTHLLVLNVNYDLL